MTVTPLRFTPPQSRLRRALLAVATLPLLALLTPRDAAAQCDRSGCGTLTAACGGTPARPVPAALWGELQAVDPNPLPSVRDASGFNEFVEPYDSRNWYFSMSTQGGYLFAGLSTGFQIWDARSTPETPTLLGRIQRSNFLAWSTNAELKWPLQDTDAADENSVASVGVGGIGIGIFNTGNKANPSLAYQNNGKDGVQVYAANINGTKYAFMAALSGNPTGGLYAYNMSAALQAGQPCLESVPAAGEPVRCPGVYLGRVGSRTSVGFVHGVDRFVVASSGASRGFDIYDFSNPASPQLKMTGLNDRSVYGVAMWKEGATYYLAARTEIFNGVSVAHTLYIYDVSCIAGSGSCSLGAPLSGNEFDSGHPNAFLSFSRNGLTPFLYLGSENRCGVQTLQREWLLDVSSPSSPRDITPAPGIYSGLTTGYWGWFYRPNPTGFNYIGPREGVFLGDYFYRAAFAIFDIHKRTGANPPVANFDWSPTEIYPGTPVTFTDRSTGGVTSRTWTFPDGTPPTSGAPSPLVVFASKGTKAVTLEARNGAGPGQTTKNVTVLDPAPQIAGITVSPANPVVCQPVTFTGTGVTGAPPLTYGWQVTQGAKPVVSSSQTSFTWDTSTLPSLASAAGTYQVALTVSNVQIPPVSPASRSVTFTLTAPAALPAAGAFAPTNDAFTNGTVQFHVNVPGATSWNWDFGSGYTGWTSDPVTGPNPTFAYTSIGSRTVRVKVRNCVEGERESSGLTINITQITPLVAGFQATGGVSCLGSTCVGTAGIAITFADLSTGPPDTWQYDWDGDGTFEQSSPTAVTTHTFTTEGTFRPALRVKRGAETSATANSQQIVVGGAGPVQTPAISVNGPSTGTVGQAYTFTATAANCTPSSSWSWNTSSGTVTGSSVGSTIVLTWDSAGTRSVSATNSGCAGAVGSRSITISTTAVNPNDPLAANFTFSPGSPRTTDAVNFDASSSTGTPVTYAWDFGDSTTGSGKTASHTYPNPGTYLVVLTVTKPGQGTNCFFGTCASSTTKAVVVSGGPPPVTADFSVTGAQCISQFGFNQCTAGTGQSLAFAASDASGTTFTWTFGDGSTATGRNVNHSYAQAGTFSVQLSVSNGQTNATATRSFIISGAPVQQGANALLLPWIAQANAGGLLQSTDFYAYNPGSEAMTLHIKFLVRGTPDPSAPTINKTIAAGATLYQQNALQTLFNQPNTSGFLYFTWDGGAGKRPVVASINRTFVGSNSFGQSVPAIPIARLEDGGATATPVQYLVGLNDTNERLSSFGVSNPYPAVATVRFRFFDKLGHQIGSPVDKTLSGFGQKQFQPAEIRGFGVRGDDYRVQVETLSGGPVYAFGTTVRLATGDPSFIPAGDPGQQTVYLVGALSQPSGGGLFRSDAVLYNPTNQVVITEMTYRNVGVTSTPTDSVTLSLQPGETRRLSDAVFSNWRLTNAVGILSFTSNSPTSQYLIAYGETYDDTHPQARYGQSMAALSSKDLAKVGQTQVLTGLIDNATTRTVLWLFNPTAESATVDLTYRALDGRVLGTRTGYVVPPGIVRQISNGTNPIPANFPEAFTVEVAVKAGSVLSSAQVIINSNSDPTYIPGQTF